MKVIIDYHHGNFTSSNYAIQKGRIQHMWEQIATHFMNYPSNEVFYELYNEPNTITTPELREALVSWISTIRQIDAERTLIVSGTEWGGINGLKSIGALPDSNLIYSFHFYEPFIFTHQGASWVGDPVATTGIPYPYDAATMPPIHPLTVGTWAENAYNYYPTSGTNATIANWLGEANAWRDTTQLPIFCGEWGTYKPFAPDDGSRCRYIEAMKTILDSMAIPYCYWEWDGGFSFFEGNPSLDSISVCMANIWDIQTIDIDDKMASMIQIFPNPVTQKLFIQNTSPSQIQFVQILDIHGKVVLYQEEYQAGISLENLPSGMYFLTIQTNIDRGTWKIIKQ